MSLIIKRLDNFSSDSNITSTTLYLFQFDMTKLQLYCKGFISGHFLWCGSSTKSDEATFEDNGLLKALNSDRTSNTELVVLKKAWMRKPVCKRAHSLEKNFGLDICPITFLDSFIVRLGCA